MFFEVLVVGIVVGCVFDVYGQMSRRPVVQIEQGVIEGNVLEIEGDRVKSFLGIPYAAPPVGALRFAPPQQHGGWNGTLQADNYGPSCPQLPIKKGESEDCLYLNIWSSNVGTYSRGPFPVIVFFEGRDFYKSSEILVSGQDLARDPLVIVTVNYRLNVFGFFCLGTSQARGNLGLLDQYFALLWIKKNIQYFGGDPEKITLFGHGSGATSVALHMISPRTADLFQRTIISSGSAVAPWLIQNDVVAASKEILRILGCNLYTVDPLMCLRSKKVEHIIQALQEYSESYNWPNMFLPVVDTFLPKGDRYLPIEPSKALKDGTFLQVPILTGITKPISHPQLNEWIELASKGFFHLQQYIEKAKIPEILRLYRFSGENNDEIFDIIKWNYITSDQGDVRILLEQLKNLEFEAKIEAPHFNQIAYLITSYVQPIYVYFIDELDLMLNTTESVASSDLLLLFGPVLLKQFSRRNFSPEEMQLSVQIKRMWTNFINIGNPTPNNNRVKPWRKYSIEDPYIEYFDTGHSNKINVGSNRIQSQRVLFWNQLLPKITRHRNISNGIPKEFQNSPDPGAGFKHAMYTLIALVVALLILLLICIILLKRRSKEREQQIHLGY